jgi:predicted DNA-binding transcriptional regulator YafY
MPKAATRNALARQWELLKCLPNRSPGLTAGALTRVLHDKGFSATKRTIERDLAALEGLFPIRCNDRSEPYGWHWLQDCPLGLPGLDCADAISLTLVEGLLRQIAPAPLLRVLEPKFKQARTKLGSTTGNRYAQWARRVRYVPPALPFLPPKIEPRHLETVQESIAQERQLKIRYSSPNDARARDYTLHPLAYIQRGPIAYLVATAFDFTDPLLFALHRMRGVQMTEDTSRAPAGFSLDTFLEAGGMQFGDDGSIRLKAVVSNRLACYLEESPLTPEQRLLAQGKERYVLTATIKNSWQLHFWILSQGAEIVVTQPKNLRVQIRDSLQMALGGYDRT